MSDYQNWICDLFKELNGPPVYPTYPPYHKDLYLEQMFVNSKEKNKDRYLIPVFWTNVYKQNKEKLLQYKLSQLNPKEKYYCVCTHDDAPKENLPTDTLVYSAGGIKTNTIPIPLVVSRIPFFEQVPKDIYASFVGSYTHSIRAIMYQYKHDDFVINVLPQWKEKIEEQLKRRIADSKKYIDPQKNFADMIVNFFSKNNSCEGCAVSKSIEKTT
jgi:hypothetical protein